MPSIGILAAQPIERGSRIRELAGAFAIAALALFDAAKIEA